MEDILFVKVIKRSMLDQIRSHGEEESEAFFETREKSIAVAIAVDLCTVLGCYVRLLMVNKACGDQHSYVNYEHPLTISCYWLL